MRLIHKTGRVVPVGTSSEKKSHQARSSGSTISAAIWSVSDQAQVSFRGAYSVERLYAFEEYCSNASLGRVLLVCGLPPLLPLGCSLLIEIVPLQNPALGWQANYLFFVRSLICSFGVAMAALLQVKNIFPDLELTSSECTKVAVTVAMVITSIYVVIASQWIFPVPFSMSLASVPFLMIFVPLTAAMIGVKRIVQLDDLWNRLVRFTTLLVIQGSLPIIYPAFALLYAKITTPSIQFTCIAVLSLIKQLLKNLLVRHATATVHDYIAEIVVFSIDAFHSIYLCTCLEITNSKWTKFILIAVDLAHHGFSFLGIRRRTLVIKDLLALRAPVFHQRSLVSIIVDMLAQPNCLDSHAFSTVRLRSCINHRLSRHASRVIRRLSISHPSQMPKEDVDKTIVDIKATPTSLLPIPLLLRRQSTDDLLVLADVLRPARQANKRSTIQGLRKSAVRILRIQPLRKSSSTRSTEQSSSSSSSGKSLVVPMRRSSSENTLPKPLAQRVNTGSFSTNRRAALFEAAKRHHRLHVFDALPPGTKTQLAHQSLALLFTIEYLSLIEYVEFIVPLVYAVYLPVLVQMPNFQFHTLLYAMLGSNQALVKATLNIVIYAAMEIATFVVFHYAIKRWLRVSPLYQVAFVLENQIEMIEGKLLAWVLYAVQFPLAHCGQ